MKYASLLNDLLDKAFRASTMGNMQLYSVIVTRDKQMKERLAPAHFKLSMMAYMAYNQRSLFAIGISYTVRLALFGTAIAFVLALLMVFLRIQEPDKRDNDFVKFLKIVANKFSRFYIFVIRGTPMMVQSLILYNAVFGLFKRTGMSVSEIC